MFVLSKERLSFRYGTSKTNPGFEFDVCEIALPHGTQILSMDAEIDKGEDCDYWWVHLHIKKPDERKASEIDELHNFIAIPEGHRYQDKAVDVHMSLKFIGQVNTTNITYYIFEEVCN